MNKRLLLILIAACCMATAAAQRLGGIVGYQLTQGVQTTTDHLVNFNATPGSGFAVGVLFDWDITNRWGLEVAATYNLRTSLYNLHYLSDTTTRFKRLRNRCRNRPKRQISQLHLVDWLPSRVQQLGQKRLSVDARFADRHQKLCNDGRGEGVVWLSVRFEKITTCLANMPNHICRCFSELHRRFFIF